MAFFFNREKPEVKEEMRMRYCAPSFSFCEGSLLDIWSLAELKKSAHLVSGKIVVLHPGLNLLLSPRQWMKELGGAYYLIICAAGEDENIRKLKNEADRIIYALVAKSLTGVSVCTSREEAETMVKTVREETQRDVVTINSTEGELKCFQ